MAVEKVTKVLVAVHEAGRDQFLRDLQQLGVFHLTRDQSSSEALEGGSREVARINAAIEFLSARADRAVKVRPVIARAEFEQIARHLEHEQILARLDSANRELATIDSRLQQIAGEQVRLSPWRSLAHDLSVLYGFRQTAVLPLKFPDATEFRRVLAALRDLPAELELVSSSEEGVYALLVCANDPSVRAAVEAALTECRYEQVDLHGVTGRPADVLALLSAEAEELKKRQLTLQQEVATLTEALPKLKVAADVLAREEELRRTAEHLPRTVAVRLLYGWVRNRDRQKLARLVQTSDVAVLVEVEPSEGEEPPVALVNRPVFRPFEMVLELFSMPSPRELDPTWLIAPFFGAFFAVCLTDAGYGLVVALAALLLMRRFGADNKLLGIVLIGGLLTIPAGALVGGWFGDLFTPERLGVSVLSRLRDALLWFDPVKEPMRFFIVSVALGYCQLIAGILFEIVDCLRVRNWGDGLLGQLPWFLLLNGLTARLVFARHLPAWAGSLLVAIVLVAVAAIVVFTQRTRETLLAQLCWFGSLAGLLIVVGTKVGWLLPVFGYAYWLTLAAFVGLLALAAVSLFGASRVRSGQQRPRLLLPQVVIGVVTIVAFSLYAAGRVGWFVPALAGILFFALSPAGRGVITKLLWGGYALYGATSYIGVVLSYIRLMALGMCTGGVAVAINVIAWMLLKMPVVGLPLALLVFIGGHTYNIAVNVLGAFVHSLRLQYVEFFPRFYSGGGEPFRPFRENFGWVTVKS